MHPNNGGIVGYRPTVWLHIGAPKTGTTALQLALEAAGPRLLEYDWYYPEAGRLGPGHHYLARAVSFSRPAPEPSQSYFDRLREEVAASRPNCVFLSSEDFCLDCDIEALKAYLSWADVKVLVYLRDPEAWINSYFAQYIKDPYFRFHDASNDDFKIQQKLVEFSHPARLLKYVEAFGADSFYARSYDDTETKRDLITAACKVSGLPLSLLKGSLSDEVANTSIGTPSLEIVRLSNILKSDEDERDRWLHELQTLLPAIIPQSPSKERKHDLGLGTPANKDTLAHLRKLNGDLIDAHFRAVGFDDANARLHLSFNDKSVRIELADIAQVTAGLSVRQSVLFGQLDSFADAVERHIGVNSAPEFDETPKALKKRKASAWVKPIPVTTIKDGDALIVTMGAADALSESARLGLASLVELGMVDAGGFFVQCADGSKQRYAHIATRDDLYAWAAGLAPTLDVSSIGQFDRFVLVQRPLLALSPFSITPREDVATQQADLALILCAKARSTNRAAYRAFRCLLVSPGGKLSAVESSGTTSPLFKRLNRWRRGINAALQARYMHVLASARPLPNSDISSQDDERYRSMVVRALDLDAFYDDLLREQFTPVAHAIGMVARRRSVD